MLFLNLFPRKSMYVTLWRPQDVDLDVDLNLPHFHRVKRKVNKYLVTLVVCVWCGSVGSEFLQFIATKGARNFDLWDMAVNISGSTLGMMLFWWIESR